MNDNPWYVDQMSRQTQARIRDDMRQARREQDALRSRPRAPSSAVGRIVGMLVALGAVATLLQVVLTGRL
jgi:hypothetical protein